MRLNLLEVLPWWFSLMSVLVIKCLSSRTGPKVKLGTLTWYWMWTRRRKCVTSRNSPWGISVSIPWQYSYKMSTQCQCTRHLVTYLPRLYQLLTQLFNQLQSKSSFFINFPAKSSFLSNFPAKSSFICYFPAFSTILVNPWYPSLISERVRGWVSHDITFLNPEYSCYCTMVCIPPPSWIFLLSQVIAPCFTPLYPPWWQKYLTNGV